MCHVYISIYVRLNEPKTNDKIDCRLFGRKTRCLDKLCGQIHQLTSSYMSLKHILSIDESFGKLFPVNSVIVKRNDIFSGKLFEFLNIT